jgi:hypothetical protein
MALTQMQIIQSLGEAMSWFERELQWGVKPAELRHLSGRLGELYAALMTNGQMATEVNQQGYDVVSASGERISVKTTSMMGPSGHIAFNVNALDKVDRVIILRINTDEMQIETLLNEPVEKAIALMSKQNVGGKASIALSKLTSPTKDQSKISTIKTAQFQSYEISELENGTIHVSENGSLISPTKPVLRNIARSLNISILNNNGNPYNTRQLGSLIIGTLND